MSSIINNLFSNPTNLTKSTIAEKNTFSPALNQGENFKRYQSKIVHNLEKKIQNANKEGFTNATSLNGNDLTTKTKNVVSINQKLAHQDKQTLDNLKSEYNSTVNEYSELVKNIKKSTTNYLDRVNPNNPYLGKNICLSDGSCGYVTQKGVFKQYPDTTIFNNTAGKNGCPASAYVNINGKGDLTKIGSEISSIPPLMVGTPMQSGQSCGNEGSPISVDRLISDHTITYAGCYADNTTTPLMTFIGNSPTQVTTDSSSVGLYTYDQCTNAAIDKGYRYFALQNVNYSTSKGYCAATNDKTTATSLGNSYKITSTIPLWSSKTTGDNKGSVAVLNGDGTLVLHNTSGTTTFSTPLPKSVKSQPNPYIGCYNVDDKSKAYIISDQYTMSFDQCQDLATNKGYQYFGIGGNTRKDKVKNCFGYNDLKTAQQNGISKKCSTQTSGGTNAASVYASDNNPTSGKSFLMLTDDGNMCIYRGTSPSDNQGLIWSSKTSGKQKDPNPVYAAAKGKYGKNWITSNSTLAIGDFVGSNNGNMALIMQPDGNLVLYTFSRGSNCKKMRDGNYGAGIGGNALYDIGKAGNLASLSKTGYIDADSKLRVTKNSTKEGFDVSMNRSGVFSIDSNMYDNYIQTGESTSIDGLKYVNSVQKQQMAQLQSKLNSLSSQITSHTNNYYSGLKSTQDQAKNNINGIHNYLNDLNTVNSKINHFDKNVENILNDSDIVVLQKNYNYIFWSALALGTILVAMNITKK